MENDFDRNAYPGGSPHEPEGPPETDGFPPAFSGPDEAYPRFLEPEADDGALAAELEAFFTDAAFPAEGEPRAAQLEPHQTAAGEPANPAGPVQPESVEPILSAPFEPAPPELMQPELVQPEPVAPVSPAPYEPYMPMPPEPMPPMPAAQAAPFEPAQQATNAAHPYPNSECRMPNAELNPWQRPYSYGSMPPVHDYDRPRYDRPAPPADPWRAHTTPPPKKKSGWIVALCCLLLAAFFFTGAVLLSAGQADWRDVWSNLPGPETRPPSGSMPSPTPAPGDASISGNDPLDASGDTLLEIVDQPANTSAPADGQPLTVKQIAEKVMPSVVGVLAGSAEDSYYGMSSGSGVIMTDDGYVITNNHVVEHYTDISVILANGEMYRVTQVRTDRYSDLAVLKIDAAGLTPAEFGNSENLAVGDPAVAIGNPLGMELQSTVTNGIISAINRDILIDDIRMTTIQTNCAINPGNSGGPLINEYGQVVGIISSKIMGDYYSPHSIEGLGFAIPSNTAYPIVNELITRGYVKGRPAIGINGRTIDERSARIMGLPPGLQGLQIVSISPDSDAYTQGLREDDIILSVFDQPVTTVIEINLIKMDYEVGDSLTVEIYRPSERRRMEISFKLVDSGEIE